MEFLREIKSTLFIMSGLYIVIGLIMLLAPVFVNNLICYLIGALCLILGGLFIYIYISSDVYGPLAYGYLVAAISLIVMGVFIVTSPSLFSSIIPFIAGVILVIDSFTKFQSASGLKRYSYDNWWAISIASVLIFIFGIVLIFNPFESLIVFIRILGLILIIDSISSLFVAKSYEKIEKKIK